MSQFYIENNENQFFELGVFCSSTIEMDGFIQHPVVTFTLSTKFKDFVLPLVYHHTTQNIPMTLHTRKLTDLLMQRHK